MDEQAGGLLEPKKVEAFQIVFNQLLGCQVFPDQLLRQFGIGDDFVPYDFVHSVLFEAIDLLNVDRSQGAHFLYNLFLDVVGQSRLPDRLRVVFVKEDRRRESLGVESLSGSHRRKYHDSSQVDTYKDVSQSFLEHIN